jgi:tripartite-type tricarboxylate transporter receptor subunit TctC
MVAHATPDGYTLLIGVAGPLAVGPAVYKNLGYDPIRDLAPIAMYASVPYVLVVNPSVPATNVKELIALAKSDPGKLTFASSGAGSSTHLSAELFKSMAGVDILHVPYKGSSQAITDVMAGQVTMLFDNAPSSIPFIEQGRLRAVAVTSTKRLPNLPDVPTIDEAGVKGYESLSWSGIVAPAATPRRVIDKLNAAIERILRDPDVRQRFTSLGVEPVGGPPEAFSRHIRAEAEKWGRVVKTANITLN